MKDKKIIYLDIGLDVATFKTGFAIFINKKYYLSGVIDCEPIRNDLLKNRMFNYGDFVGWAAQAINLEISKIFNMINKDYDLWGKEHTPITNIVFEYNDHGSRALSTKLTMFVGIYQSAISSALALYMPATFRYNKLSFKQVYAQFWKAKIEEQRQLREFSKQNSIEWASKIANKTINNDDEADAVIMAKFANKLKDRMVIKNDKNLRAKNKQKYTLQLEVCKAKINTLETEADNREKAGKQRFTSQKFITYTNQLNKKDELRKRIQEINDYHLFQKGAK